MIGYLVIFLSGLTCCNLMRITVLIEPSDDQDCVLFKQIENVLTTTSQQLNNTTRSRLEWDRVAILVPKSMALQCNSLLNNQIKSRRIDTRKADFIIQPGSHPLLHDIPYAQQYGPCGQSGLAVHLSRPFIQSFNSTLFHSGRLVLREWMKNRYGLFDETGFDSDPQYPRWTSEYGSHPPIHLANSSSLLQENSCTTTRDEEEWWNQTGQVKASIMARLDAEDWCDSSNHIRWMPTKHNVLCQEQSLWQVMENHPDFLDKNESDLDTATEPSIYSIPPPPEFEYFYSPSSQRYVLVLDRSSSSQRWNVIRRALYRWIHALPADEETYLSLIVTGDQDGGQTSSVVLGWTKVTTENRDGLVGRIPRRPILSSSAGDSLVSAIQLAHQILADEKDGGQLILLTGSSIDLSISFSDQVIIHTIAFPSRTAWINLTTNGLQLAVDDSEDPSMTQSRLTTAFLQILGDNNPTQVYQELVTNGINPATGSFQLDAPLGNDLRIVAHCQDEADLDTIQLISPSGKIYDLPLVSDGMLHIRIPHTDEFGLWNYRLGFAPAPSSSARHPTAAATLQVTAQPSARQETITVEAWTNLGRQPVNASQTPILFYVQVKKGRSPVIDAKVTALVYPPNGQDNTTTFHGPFVIQLYDRGTGDPDITRADGIYSAYFTRAVDQPGHYAVMIQVTDDSNKASIPIRKAGSESQSCCGSSMPYEQTLPLDPFRRLISGPSFVTIDGPDEDQDVYPPGRISDLRVERIINTTNEVELGWTAPGTDYDSGSAAFYQIRCYTDRSALNDSSSAILVHASLTPQPLPAGTWQKAMVAVPWPNQIFYYAIVAVDFAGLRGKVSNIVPVYIEEPPPPPTTTTQSSPIPDYPVNVTGPEAAVQALTEQQLYAIAGGVAGFVLLLIILSIAACLSRRKRDHPEEKPKSSPSSMKIQVEPLKIGSQSHPLDSGHQKEQEAMTHHHAAVKSAEESRPVYKIYVNNAYIQEEDGELKIVTPDGRIIQRGSPWFSSATLPRGRSLTNLEGLEAGTSATDLHHWSLPRAKTSPHRHKVLTNGSIMPTSGSQSVININNPSSSGVGAIADGTSISSKPSVSSDDTGIEVSDHQTDSRDSADLQMILPPPGFGPIQQQQSITNGYMPMYANHNMLPPLPPSPGMSQDARVIRIPSFLNNNGENNSGSSWLGDLNDSNFCSQPSSRRPLMIGSYGAGSSEDRTPQISPPPPSTPTSQSSVLHQPTRRKTRHISFV